jgi:Pilus assembly protein, PilO
MRQSRTFLALGLGTALAAVTLLGYLLLIAPKRSEAADLDAQIATTRKLLELPPSAVPPAPSDETTERTLDRVLPDRIDQPAVVLELSRLADRSALRLDGITVQPVIAGTGYQALPIELIVQGRFFSLGEFLARLRRQATVRDGKVLGPGRLYSVESLSLAEGDAKFPRLAATVRVSTFFGAAGAAPAAAGASTTTPAAPNTESAGSSRP